MREVGEASSHAAVNLRRAVISILFHIFHPYYPTCHGGSFIAGSASSCQLARRQSRASLGVQPLKTPWRHTTSSICCPSHLQRPASGQTSDATTTPPPLSRNPTRRRHSVASRDVALAVQADPCRWMACPKRLGLAPGRALAQVVRTVDK